MKNIFLLVAFCFFAFAPTSKIAAQKSFGEELLEAFFTGVIEGLIEGLASDSDNGETQLTDGYEADIQGTWQNGSSMLIFSGVKGFSEATPTGEVVMFAGEYRLENDILEILEYDGTVRSSWRVNTKGSKLTLSWPGKSSLTYTYSGSVDEHFGKKDREIANLTANANRIVTFGQSDILSKGIRLDIQKSDMQRSYDTERIQALEYAKQWRQLGNEEQARAWEKKADDCAYEIRRLDNNN